MQRRRQWMSSNATENELGELDTATEIEMVAEADDVQQGIASMTSVTSDQACVIRSLAKIMSTSMNLKDESAQEATERIEEELQSELSRDLRELRHMNAQVRRIQEKVCSAS